MALKDLIRRRPWALESALLARNTYLALPGRSGSTRRIGSTHSGADAADAAGYVERVLSDYVRYGGLDRNRIEGSRVLEIGPGDNLGVALRFIGAGAESVVCIERFRVWRDQAHQAAILGAVVERAEPEARARMEAVAVDSGDGIELDPDRIRLIEGTGIEEADLEESSFDICVSRAVLEYVQAMDRALRVMDRALARGGVAIHKIDLRDHGLYTGAGHSPLAFLRRGPGVYRRMATRTGIPNRWRESDYVSAFEKLGYGVESLITHLIGESEELEPHQVELTEEQLDRLAPRVEAERGKLAEKFASRTVRDLGVAGIFDTATKPV